MSADSLQMIVGLGNPGKDYESTRHNAGFWFIEQLLRQLNLSLHKESRFSGEMTSYLEGGTKIWLLKPMTFMNRSGQAIGSMMKYYSLKPEQILVVHDELDLPPGTARIKLGGGHGGHNGLRDTINHLGTKDFYRLRLGIGHPGDRAQVVNYVLGKVGKQEKDLIDQAISNSLNVLPILLEGHIQKAMNLLHSS